MKRGGVVEEWEGRAAARGFVNEMAHGAEEGRQALEHFGDSDDGDLRIVSDDFDAGGAHLGAAHAEDCDVEALLQGGGEAGGVHVPGSFAGGEKERYGWHDAIEQESVAGREDRRFG